VADYRWRVKAVPSGLVKIGQVMIEMSLIIFYACASFWGMGRIGAFLAEVLASEHSKEAACIALAASGEELFVRHIMVKISFLVLLDYRNTI